MLDINGSEFLVIVLVAVILIGPERLPDYVRGLRTAVRRVRGLVREGQSAIATELGEDLDWSKIDPRQYDPRTIVREALMEDDVATPATGTASIAALASGAIGTDATGGRRERRAEAAAARRAAAAKVLAERAEAAGPPVDLEAT